VFFATLQIMPRCYDLSGIDCSSCNGIVTRSVCIESPINSPKMLGLTGSKGSAANRAAGVFPGSKWAEAHFTTGPEWVMLVDGLPACRAPSPQVFLMPAGPMLITSS
jgi:hypothetical protein